MSLSSSTDLLYSENEHNSEEKNNNKSILNNIDYVNNIITSYSGTTSI